jgi:hypothetical protein
MASTATKNEKSIIKHAITELGDNIEKGTEINVIANIPDSGAINTIVNMSKDDVGDVKYASYNNSVNIYDEIQTTYNYKIKKTDEKGIYISEPISFSDYKVVDSLSLSLSLINSGTSNLKRKYAAFYIGDILLCVNTSRYADKAVDISNNNIELTSVNSPVFKEKDVFGGNNAMYLANNAYIKIAGNLIDTGSSNFTLSFWSKIPSDTSRGWQAVFGAYTSNSYMVWSYGKNSTNYYYMSFNGGDTYQNAPCLFSDSWQHNALVRIGDTLYCYINGILVCQFALNSGQVFNFPSLCLIGSSDWGYTQGYISDLCIIKKAIFTEDFKVPNKYMFKYAKDISE